MRTWPWIALVLAGAGAYFWTRPYGALTGAVKLTSSRPAVGLTWWTTKGQPGGWEGQLGAFDFVTVKTMQSTGLFDPEEGAPVIAAARAQGVPVHSWGWANSRTPEEGRAEGLAAAKVAGQIGAGAHWVNAEHQWAGTLGEPGAADPVGSIAAFVQGFRELEPGIPLVFNGATSWTATRLKGLDDQIASLFDVYGPMIYSAGAEGGVSTMRKKWIRGSERARRVGIPYAPMIGSGRQDAAGKYWTNLEAVADIQEEHPADWIAVWMGPSFAPRIWSSNQLNPSLTQFAQAVS